ncbi:MAG: restriction endonuclease subunit S [Nostoc sp. NMS7]|uniref:restriction endonuclease subunit S n=1 Tax=Nostoc sp. NMS7 TaxID=2815391 RepID=UPI0025E10EAD|nr:restriction endonuclease subunit S [Nostoc sp. NMS7]MBN3945204.1 restriction endonuclease subunit S [Nostoc sp. NMS7]
MKKNWVKKKIGEIGKVQTGSTPKTSKNDNFGDYIPFIKPPDFFKNGSLDYKNQGISEIGLNQARLVESNSVLMVCIGATIGKVGFTKRQVTTNQQINSLTPLNGDCAKFLFYQMLTQNFQRKVLDSSGQATLPIINKTKWSNLSLYLPPLPEQKQIVAILDEAFEGIDRAIANTEKNFANARELFESYLNAIFTQKGDGWVEKKLGVLLDTLTDYHANGSYEILKQNVTLLDNDGYAYIVRSTDFENNFTNHLKYIDKHAYEFLSKSKVFGGEIIISKIGNAGKVYLMPSIDRPCSLAMNLFLLRTDVEQIQSNYLYLFLESRFGKVQISERLNGTTTKTIRKDGIRSLNILVAPLPEQKNIVDKLDSIVFETQRLETIYHQKLSALNELKQSILQKAFTSELTADTANQTTKTAKEGIAA